MSINIQKTEFVISAAKKADFPRDQLPQVVFAGRSNVGKSSVINCLLGRKNFARVGNSPGKTTHINYFKVDNQLYLVDLPRGTGLCPCLSGGARPVGTTH